MLIETNSSRSINRTPQFAPTEFESENRKVWVSLPLHIAIYFAALDKFTFEDEFYIALRGLASERLHDRGITRVGELLALTKAEAAVKTGMTPAELGRVSRVLTRMGLSFGSDVDAWRRYRATVDPEFRLTIPFGMRLPDPTRSPFDT